MDMDIAFFLPYCPIWWLDTFFHFFAQIGMAFACYLYPSVFCKQSVFSIFPWQFFICT